MNASMRPLNLIITGVGGQGNVATARLLGTALLAAGYETSVGDVFGLTQRGGSVASHVRFWQGPPLPPLVPRGHMDLLLAFEPLEAVRVLAEFGHDATAVLVNTVPIPPVGVLTGRTTYPPADDLLRDMKALAGRVVPINGLELAHQAGEAQVLNIVMLGGLLGMGLLPIGVEALEEEVARAFPPRFLDFNGGALRLGTDAAWGLGGGGMPEVRCRAYLDNACMGRPNPEVLAKVEAVVTEMGLACRPPTEYLVDLHRSFPRARAAAAR